MQLAAPTMAGTAAKPAFPAFPASWNQVAAETGFARFQLDGPMSGLIDAAGRPELDRSGQAQLTHVGTGLRQALEAARQLARTTQHVELVDGEGVVERVAIDPAVALLHDPQSGYWITTLETSIEYDDSDFGFAHAIDGPSVGPGQGVEHVNVVPELDAVHFIVGASRTIDFLA